MLRPVVLFMGGVAGVLTLGVWGMTDLLVDSIGTDQSIVNSTLSYLRIRSLGLPFDSLTIVALMSLKGRRRGASVLSVTTATVLFGIVVDNALYGNAGYSLNMGTNGVAWGYVASRVFAFCLAWAIVLTSFKMPLRDWLKGRSESYVRLFRIGGYTGFDSLARNLFYGMTLVILNTLGASQFGGYGLSMTIIWSALIPVLALAEVTNISVGEAYGRNDKVALKGAVKTSSLILLGVNAVLVCGLLWWDDLATFLNGHADIVTLSKQSAQILAVPYLLFSWDVILKSIFIGSGETRYIFFTTLLVAAIISAPGIWAYKAGLWSPDFSGVLLFLGAGFVVDFVFTLFFASRVIRKVSLAKRWEK